MGAAVHLTSAVRSLTIAGVTTVFRNRTACSLVFDEAYREFLGQEEDGVAVDVYDVPPEIPEGASDRRTAPGYWQIERLAEHLVFRVCVSPQLPGYFETFVLHRGWDRGEFFFHPPPSLGSMDTALTPLQYPMDFLVYSKLLLRRQAAILHACAVLQDGRCLVFAGGKGAGKSTLAQLSLRRGARVLSEEQIVLSLEDGRLWAHGSPWYGTTRHCWSRCVPVDALFFIEHGRAHVARRLAPDEAVRSLFARMFVATLFREEVPILLTATAAMAGCVPAYRYAFLPDASALDEAWERAGG